MDIFSFLLNHYSFKKIINSDSLKISATNDEFNMMLVAADFYANDKSVFVVLPNLYQAQKYYDGSDRSPYRHQWPLPLPYPQQTA